MKTNRYRPAAPNLGNRGYMNVRPNGALQIDMRKFYFQSQVTIYLFSETVFFSTSSKPFPRSSLAQWSRVELVNWRSRARVPPRRIHSSINSYFCLGDAYAGRILYKPTNIVFGCIISKVKL